jgi:hypothetical protein
MNLKRKLLKCNANINFNKSCLKQHTIPKYANLTTKQFQNMTTRTKQKIEIIRIKQELKLLYAKIQKINKALYHGHIKEANTWTVTWQNIEYTVNKKLEIKMNKMHNKQNKN